ncbi:hypothetical protein [Cardinium endosymbiont of Philonthus spinipes]|uniref:hypothetical protein n=1 Tax=Cardinium endosymbiont of Philonthus spinipes TaxID=3077941 RepID=UPI00313DB917
MRRSITITVLFLLCCILQNGCWTKCSSATGNYHNPLSGGPDIGKFSDIGAYEQTLAPQLKNSIFSMLKGHLIYPRFLKRIGADSQLLPMQLSLEQQKAWHKIYLLYIDLYRIFYIVYQYFKPFIVAHSGEAKSEAGFMDLSDESLDLMAFILGSSNNDEILADSGHNHCTVSYMKLKDTIDRHYILSFNSYIAGGDLETFENSVHVGRSATAQAIKEFIEIIATA